MECDPPCAKTLAAARQQNKQLYVGSEAYQATCARQASKLMRMEQILMSASIEAGQGLNVKDLHIRLVHFDPSNSTLYQLAEVLKEKGNGS